MFWGVALENGKRYSQVVETTYHVSMAALEPSMREITNANKYVSLMLEHSKTEFLLCTLEYNKVMQVNLDLNFVEGEEVTFYLNGEGTIHLTGYIISEDDDQKDSSSEDDEVKLQSSKMLAPKAVGSSKIENDEEDEEDDEDWIPPEVDTSKRKKRTNGETPENLKLKKKAKLDESKSERNSVNESKSEINVSSEMDEDDAEDLDESGSNSDDSESRLDEESSAEEEGNEEQWGSLDEDNQENGGWGKSWGAKGQPVKQAVTDAKAQSKPQKVHKQTPKRPSDAFTTKSPTNSQDSPFKKLAGGVQSHDIVEGKGPVATPGKKLHVYYTGRLVNNNKEFDSLTKGSPFTFKLGQGDVIKGWDVALKGMRVGGKRKIIVPPSMGYGNKSMGPIPPNSSLQFDIELKAVTN